MTDSTKVVVYAALLGNLLVALTKAFAAAWTGSSAMESEAIHSFVDTGNELLLLYGMRRARQRADPQHPLGYGRELYFWSFVVALLVFALGAGLSMYQGIMQLLQPEPIKDAFINYLVLALAFVFEGASWLISLRQFKASKGSVGFYEAAHRSKDPPSFMVFFEDSAALVGIALAALGTFMSTSGGMPRADGVASVAIGAVLAAIAIMLARESKSLLIGEPAARELQDSILRIASGDRRCGHANGVLTVQLSPNQIAAALSVEFADELSATEIENFAREIERQVKSTHPEVVMLFLKPQSAEDYRAAVQRRYGSSAER